MPASNARPKCPPIDLKLVEYLETLPEFFLPTHKLTGFDSQIREAIGSAKVVAWLRSKWEEQNRPTLTLD